MCTHLYDSSELYILYITPPFYYINYTLTLHCTFLTSGGILKMIYNRNRSKGEQESPVEYQVYFCKDVPLFCKHLLRDILFL